MREPIAKRPRDDAPFETRKAYHELSNVEKWGPGPWAEEPNRELWKSQGFDCLINRNRLGSWCGYVGVPSSHPLYGKTYSELEEKNIDLEAHGGITYSNFCQGEICHPTDEGEPVYWFGFDCAHAWDLIPGMHALREFDPLFAEFRSTSARESYRDMAYVKAEVEKLALQLKEKQ